jgi:hypothetical protein
MRISPLVPALGLILCAVPARAVDLTKIDRAIAKEPAYQDKPKYCLVVFGQKAKFPVWLVRDGDSLYVDRNGNGDLTDKEERIANRSCALRTNFDRFSRLSGSGPSEFLGISRSGRLPEAM